MPAGAAGGGPQYRAAVRLAKRGIPVALELYRRWQELTPEQRERYMRTARQYAERAGDVYSRRRGRLGGRDRPRRF